MWEPKLMETWSSVSSVKIFWPRTPCERLASASWNRATAMARFQRRKWSIWNEPSINITSQLGRITECLFMPSHWSHLCVIRLLPMLSIPDQSSCIAGIFSRFNITGGQCLLCLSLKSSPFSFIVPKRTWALEVMGPCAKSPCSTATKWDHQSFFFSQEGRKATAKREHF